MITAVIIIVLALIGGAVVVGLCLLALLAPPRWPEQRLWASVDPDGPNDSDETWPVEFAASEPVGPRPGLADVSPRNRRELRRQRKLWPRRRLIDLDP